MRYLKIDPVTQVAIGGMFSKYDWIDSSEYADYRAVSGGAQVGWTWDSVTETWTSPSARLISLQELRIERDRLLAKTDFESSRWADLTSDDSYTVTETDTATHEAYLAYRKSLRDITIGYVPVESPIWPEDL